MIEYNIDVLIRARQLQSMTRTVLAAKCGRSENMIWKIENGSRTSEKTIFRMAAALGVDMKDVLRDPAKTKQANEGRPKQSRKKRRNAA